MAGVRRPVGPTPKHDNLSLCAATRDFKSFVGRLENVFDISLPVPQFESLASLKQFCVGLLLPSSAHIWARPVRKLCLRDRLSISGSLFLFRKVLPSSTPSLSSYKDKMEVDSAQPSVDYMRFVSQEIKRMFPYGWDRRWGSCVRGTTVRTSSCLESSRRRGGCLGALDRHNLESREVFCKYLLDKSNTSLYGKRVNRVRVLVAQTAGKDRIVTVNSVDMTYLDPYHRLLYDKISEQDWCLRGDARASRFSGFTTRGGEVFVSGDYESATDNLNRGVAIHILNLIGDRCHRVPLSVRTLAGETLRCRAESEVGEFTVRRGQLMGNSMSFPLLCLQNWLAFRYLVRREDVPVKINGDDIVFRSTPREYEVWKAGVSNCGLTLSEGKTAVSRNWFSLNSTFFVSGTKRVREAPVVRSTAFFTNLEDVGSLGGRLDTLRRFRPDRRDYLQSSLLSRFSGALWSSERSVRRGLGWRVSDEVLRRSGLLERESFYLSLDKYHDPPLPQCQNGYFRSEIPDGWERVRSRTKVNRKDQVDFFKEVVDLSWKPAKLSELREKRKRLTVHFVKKCRWRFAKCLGLGRGEWRKLFTRLPPRQESGVPRWVRHSVAGSSVSVLV